MPFQVFIVNFSRYSDEYQSLEKIKNIPAKDIFKSYQIDITANLSINIDVTNLIFLKPGSVWKNGSDVSYSEGDSEFSITNEVNSPELLRILVDEGFLTDEEAVKVLVMTVLELTFYR